MPKLSFYKENVLNRFDNVTYNWTMYMIRPEDVGQVDDIIRTNRVKIIAQSGVESEINIVSVEHDMKLAFNKQQQDRESLANVFSFQLSEPLGATLYTRIFKAAKDLGLPNHLKACYLLELRFLGYEENGTPVENITSPYYWTTVMTGLDFQYNEGATTYRADLIETSQEGFKKLALYMNKAVQVSGTTFGEYLSNLQEMINEQEKLKVINSTARKYPHNYTFGFGDRATEWADWSFDVASGDNPLTSVSITGEGALTFNIKKGTSISDLILLGLYQTKNFRKLPTGEGGFHKDNPNDPVAKAKTFGDLSSWFAFETECKYRIYDVIANDYAKDFTINIQRIIAQEVHHDVISYQKVLADRDVQQQRIRNMATNDMLVKRFDYYHTGVNTEVLSLDVYLNQAYYQIQALNQGAGKFVGQNFAGSGSPNNEYNIKSSELENINQELRNIQDELISLENRRKTFHENLKTAPPPGQLSPDQVTAKVSEFDNQKKDLLERQKQLEKTKGEVEQSLIPLLDQEEARERLQQGENVITGGRYLTQSELIGSNPEQRESHPLTHDVTNINSKATNGPDQDDTSGAVYLGAVELNLNSLGDLVSQRISIRGDPYWLGRPRRRKSHPGAHYEQGGVTYFLNLNFPTYPDEQDGFMKIPESNYGIVGLYKVVSVVARYQDGQFTMDLDAFRDINTNLGLVWEEISTGLIDIEPTKKQEPLKLPEDQGEGDGEEGTEKDSTTGPDLIEEGIVDGDVTNPNVIEAQIGSSSTIRNQAIKPELKNILASAANKSGLNVVVYSGGQPAKGSGGRRTGTRRHDNGAAADIRLQDASGRTLSLDNPRDVPLIQNFLREAKNAGATGIGAGNGYMGNNGFHVDIAAKFGQAPGGSAYWGGLPDASGRIRAKNAPQFLKDIMTG